MLQKNEQVPVNFDAKEVRGVVEFVSPTTDAQSGTTRVKVRVPNPNLALQSGDACTLIFEGSGVARQGITDASVATKPVGLQRPCQVSP